MRVGHFSKLCQFSRRTLRTDKMSSLFAFRGKCEGFEGRKNELYITSKQGKELKRNVIFFPGDIQNYEAKMSKIDQAKAWTNWSYERVASILHEKFPDSCVWIVVPSVSQDEIFSSYENFMLCDGFCAPVDYRYFSALAHLKLLLENGSKLFQEKLKCSENPEKVSDKTTSLTGLPLILLGFSKGCVVLNQFVFELEDAHKDDDLLHFVRKITSFYWLDGGHTGQSEVWIVEPHVLNQLLAFHFEIHVHVSLYQVQDKLRPHIERQERIFVDFLKSKNADITEKLHFPEKRSLANHFKILDGF